MYGVSLVVFVPEEGVLWCSLSYFPNKDTRKGYTLLYLLMFLLLCVPEHAQALQVCSSRSEQCHKMICSVVLEHTHKKARTYTVVPEVNKDLTSVVPEANNEDLNYFWLLFRNNDIRHNLFT
jgi:hypothetical protein